MASSRWKRFAFFDRKTYALPQPVYDDIFSSTSTSAISPSFDSSTTSPTKSERQQRNDRNDISDNVSLVVINGAGIPYASLRDNNNNVNSDLRLGVVGMANALEACNNNYAPDINGTDTNDKNHDNVMKDVYQFSSTGQTLSVPNDVLLKKNGNVNGSLVLAFASSKSTCNVHCVDLTIRCNPIHESSSMKATTATENSDNSQQQQQQQQQQQEMLEDLDGWRGYFTPFAYDITPADTSDTIATTTAATTTTPIANITSTQSSNLSSAIKNQQSKKIVAVAVCSDHQTSTKVKSGKNIYVACITNANHSIGVTVHRNPHLYLNSHLHVDDSDDHKKKIKATPKVEVYQPVGEFDYKHHGRPCCVEISYKSGIVAVGTDTGMVILYSLNSSMIGSNKSAGGQEYGSNGTKKLTLLMEIPAPITASSSAIVSDGTKGLGRNSAGDDDHSLSKDLHVAESEVTCLKFMYEPIDSIEKEEEGRMRRKNHGLKTKLFVTYRRIRGAQNRSSKVVSSNDVSSSSGGGLCCYDIGMVGSITGSKISSQLTPAARYDLDGREVLSSSLCDMVISNFASSHDDNITPSGDRFMIARSDGLYTYSSTDKMAVSPIDGNKIAMCSIPPPPLGKRRFNTEILNLKDRQDSTESHDGDMNLSESEYMYMKTAEAEAGASYALVATTDSKSGRDAVDIYDAANKLVAFHILLSPGHKAIQAAGITTTLRSVSDGSSRGGLSSAIVITTGGSIVTITEKVTADKVALLSQKNLYSAAISMAYADSSYKASDITSLFRRHAEHLYHKGDFTSAMDQYIHTIGSLEPSHVIFRFLDAPKIPLLTKYLEKLRSRNLATSVHCELLKTCYLKLNDVNMAKRTSSLLSKSLTSSTCTSLVSNLLHNPTEALATICSFEAPHVVEALKVHGSVLARASPRETAGIVISLCDGVYSPGALSNIGDRRKITDTVLKEMLESKDHLQTCDKYPVHLFSTAFMENPKLLRVILSYCFKNKHYLTSSLRRTLLQFTLEEWNSAKHSQNKSVESIRKEEAIAILSDPQSSERLGDYESLVIVQQYNFVEGEILLYEKLQMISLLVEKYAMQRTYKARRKMLALCRSDPDILGEVLGYFVGMVNEKLSQKDDDVSVDSESEIGELLQDVKEALQIARAQKAIPPVRIARILAGEGAGQFQNECYEDERDKHLDGVPLSVTMDYVGGILDEKGKEVERLQNDVDEYSRMCNAMETEINELLEVSRKRQATSSDKKVISNKVEINIDIDAMCRKLVNSAFETKSSNERASELNTEEFWRAMDQADDRFHTISQFFAKDIID